MMQFKRLIQKYSVPLTITRQNISTSGNRKTESPEDYYTENIAVFNPEAKDIEKYEALEYVSNGLKLYVPDNTTAIRQSDDVEVDFQLQDKDKFEWKNDTYKVSDPHDRREHSDFQIFVATKEVV